MAMRPIWVRLLRAKPFASETNLKRRLSSRLFYCPVLMRWGGKGAENRLSGKKKESFVFYACGERTLWNKPISTQSTTRSNNARRVEGYDWERRLKIIRKTTGWVGLGKHYSEITKKYGKRAVFGPLFSFLLSWLPLQSEAGGFKNETLYIENGRIKRKTVIRWIRLHHWS
jgi:hypothetical protein